MLTFLVYDNGKPPKDWTLRNAHLLGAEDVGVRAGIHYEAGRVVAEKTAPGPAALALQYEVKGLGEFMLQTCLLPERGEPYHLTVELARHRLMKLIAKQEDWAMFDVPQENPAYKLLETARKKFIAALVASDDPGEADKLARASLTASLEASEELALTHADVLIHRRSQAGGMGRYAFGAGVGPEQQPEDLAHILQENFDYLRLPMPWRTIEPREQHHHWVETDRWCDWAVKQRMPIVAGPLVAFYPGSPPDWLYTWEHDYDTIRDLSYEHIEAVVHRYRNVVSLWNVASGLHVNAHFSFSMEQVMDLTRTATMLVKKLAPASRVLIELTQPFGEYFAQNQRSIPPVMYAEMLAQSSIPFDAYGLRLVIGQGGDGQWVRDLMQVSALLDRFNGLGKPVHVTAAAAPSSPPASGEKHKPRTGGSTLVSTDTSHGGFWRKPWSPQLQSLWAEAFYKVALSKPFVESVAWLDLSDHKDSESPSSGLLDDRFTPKPALRRIAALRQTMRNNP